MSSSNPVHILQESAGSSENGDGKLLNRRDLLRCVGAALGTAAFAGCGHSSDSSDGGSSTSSASNGPTFAGNYGTFSGTGSFGAPISINTQLLSVAGDFIVLAVAAYGNNGTINPGIFNIATTSGTPLSNFPTVAVVDPTKNVYLWVFCYANAPSLSGITLTLSNLVTTNFAAVILEFTPFGILVNGTVGQVSGSVAVGQTYVVPSCSTPNQPDLMLGFVAWSAPGTLASYLSPYTAILGVTGSNPISLSPASAAVMSTGNQTMYSLLTNAASMGQFAGALLGLF